MIEERVNHNISPVYDAQSEILILGSFPSVKSREACFFYGHPQNRFWKVLAVLFHEDVPEKMEEKRAFLIRNHIAVWDVIASCTITGSSDSSIKDVIVNDLTEILEKAHIKNIYVNGATAWKMYKKYTLPKTGIEAIKLPSTSPANASYRLERLVSAWSEILKSYNNT